MQSFRTSRKGQESTIESAVAKNFALCTLHFAFSLRFLCRRKFFLSVYNFAKLQIALFHRFGIGLRERI